MTDNTVRNSLSAKYSVNSYTVGHILSWIETSEIAIPEIQRPFVWSSSKVRDLMDSLYKGYPVGYLIAWKNPSVRLKDGSLSDGKKILIDGQQRVTALMAALLGQRVMTDEYKTVPIKIAFHPGKETFEVQNPAILKSPDWVHDISEIVGGGVSIIKAVKGYLSHNPDADEERIESTFEQLKTITQKQIGLIELAPDLDIETVTEIFIRINSKGVVLSNADFAMSKIAANEAYGGHVLRKAIDYFCHLAIAPEFYRHIRDNDPGFATTHFFQKMSWLRNENDDIYDPTYTDLLRVAFTSRFDRGRLEDLVALLSGRNFETRTYEEEIAASSFEKLEEGVLAVINETNFKNYVMIIRSAGFVASRMLRSQNVLDFGYILYLTLRHQGYNAPDIERWVRKWLVMSMLTGRYSGSPESAFDYDIRQIRDRPFPEFLEDVEDAALSDAFWTAALIQQMNTTSTNAAYFHVYLAAQVYFGDKGFLSRDISVQDLIAFKGDVHHIFPKDYLKKQGHTRGTYNQIANYVYMQSDINIRIGNAPPRDYFARVLEQCTTGTPDLGGIADRDVLKRNLAAHCIPESVMEMTEADYREFLEERRGLMAEKMRRYYEAL